MKNNTTHTTRRSTRGQQLRPKAAALAVAACFSSMVWANPTNPTVVHGTASFQQAGNILNVTNSHNAIINWGSFSIGVNELTRFIQPSALSAVLNRVTGQDPSAILGALQSNGKVFLLNPNGIVFGAGSQINVGGLVASTLNLSNADFLAGRMNFTDGAGAGSVLNQGSINAAGGPVYMVGNAVTNQGIITSPGGEVILAAGNSVELVNPGTPNLRVEIQAASNEARNLGSVVAEAGRIGIYAGLIKQGGTLNADSAVAEGGRIMLKSTKRTDLEAGSVTSAKGTTGGQIIALSDMNNGVTQVSGKLDASATNGNGGFIETSAATVNVADSAVVTTLGGNGGVAGTWLIDPADFLIASYGGNITGSTLSANLMGGNITHVSGTGGNVLIQDNVSWSSGTTLTLSADADIMFGVGSGTALDGGTTGSVVLNAGGSILTNNTGLKTDIRAGSFTGNASGMIGNLSYPLRTEVSNVNLSSSGGSGEINLINTGNLNVLGATVANGPINLQSSVSLVAGSGATIHAANGDVNLRSELMDFSAATIVKGNNIDLGNLGGDFIIGSAADTLTSASFSKMELNTPASGRIRVSSNNNIFIHGPVSILPAKAERLELDAEFEIGQSASGSIAVKKLYVDGNEGGVYLDSAANSVGFLAGRSKYDFYFTNSGNLEIGTVGANSGITVDGGTSGALIDVRTTSGNLEVQSGTITATAGYPSTDATILLHANAGNVTIVAPITATSPSDATVEIHAANTVTFVGASPVTASATDGRITVVAGTGNIVLNGGRQLLASGNDDAEINLQAGGNIVLGNTSVLSSTAAYEADIYVTAGGNITQNAAVTADGAERGFISLNAGGMIQQTNATGFLKATGSSYYYDYNAVNLTAVSGIGDRVNPIRIDMAGDPEINANSNGVTGNIGLSFFNTSSLMTYHTVGGLTIDYLGNVSTNNPTGTYYIRSDTNIELVAPFTPGNNALLPGQKVVLDAPNGQIHIGQLWSDGGEGYMPTGIYGSIRAGVGGTGNVELIAGGKLTIESGSFVSGFEPLIKAGDIDLQGAIRSLGDFVDIRHIAGGPIHLGLSGDGVGGALALDATELNRMSGWNGTGDPLDPGASGGLLIGEITGGPLIFKGSVGPTAAFLNVRGSTVTQDAGVITGGLNASAQSGVTLSGSNQISYITGGVNGSGNFSVNSSAPMEVGNISTPGGNISVSSSGGMTLVGQLNAGTGTVTLSTASTGIADNNVGIDIIANSAVINASYGGSIGSIANPLETSVLDLTVNSAAIGSQEIGVINSGNLNLAGLSFGGSLASIGTTGTLTTGNIYVPTSGVYLAGNNGISLTGRSIYANGLTLDAGSGALQIVGATSVGSAGSLTLKGASVLIDGSYAYGGNGSANSTNVVTGGNLHVVNLGQLGTYGSNTNVDAGGSVLVDRSTVRGYPDINMKVGGTININGTMVEPGRIAAESPHTINISFPNQSSGGFFVNGVATVFDAATNSGFFVVGDPAVLGTNMFVTYGTGTTISPPVDTLIVALTQAAKPPAEQQSTGTTSTTEEDKDKTVKKGTMVCR